MSTSFDKLNTWLGLIFLTLCAALFGYRFVSSEARAGRQFLEDIPLTEVTYVRLDPASDHPLVDRPLVVCDKPDIRALLASMTAMERYSPQHPNTTWSIAIRIGTNEHEYGGVITGTSNQGVLFRYSSKITTGWNGTYLSIMDAHEAAALRARGGGVWSIVERVWVYV